MPITADLTNADLDDLRQSALGAADPLGVAADLADAADAGRLADPDDAGYALTLAAEIAENRAKHEAALRYADRAVEAYGKRDDSQVAAAHALRARILFRSGREDEALAELEPLRPRLTEYPDAAAYLSAALAAGGRHKIAEEWLTEAVRDTLAARAGAEPASAEDAGLLFFLLQQRHQIRHALGLPHDGHDNLADRLETKLANTTVRPAAVDPVFWPQAEFDRLLAQWPTLAEPYGATWDEHRARLQRELVRSAVPVLLRGSVDGLIGYAGPGGDPADPQVRAGYISKLAVGAESNWPPERNGPCWCGSGNKYKKCCLPRARD